MKYSVLLFAILFQSSLLLGADDDIVIPKGPGAQITRSLTPFIQKWNHETLSSVIEKSADFPTKPLVLSALGLAEEVWSQPGMSPHGALVAAQAAIDAGSVDPMMGYLIARFSDLPPERLLPAYTRVFANFSSSPYPASRRFFCAMRILECLRAISPRDEAAITATCEQAEAELMKALAETADSERGAIALHDSFQLLITTDKWARQPLVGNRILKELSETTVPPWWRDTLSGLVHIELAWGARGNGWSNTVTEDGWKGFHEHMDAARNHLVAAWKLHPERPQSATALITVAMAGSDSDGSVTRWFNRAVASQIDYLPAYVELFSALQPRWGGSYEQMLAVGLAASQTKRYDSDAPWQLMQAVHSIFVDALRMNTPHPEALKSPDVYKACMATVEGYRALHPGNDGYYDSRLAITAWMCGFPHECLKRLDAAKGHVDESCFTFIHYDEAKLRNAALYDIYQNDKQEGTNVEAEYDFRWEPANVIP